MTKDEVNKMSSLELHLYMSSNLIKDKTIRSNKVYGVGTNDADYLIYFFTDDGKQITCPCYAIWANILTRCYMTGERKKFKRYHDVRVHDDWLLFSNFRKWWVDHYVENGSIDKDILYHPMKHGPYKTYGPETSVFVPDWVNSAAISSPPGKLGRGVMFSQRGKKSINHKKRYKGYIKDHSSEGKIETRTCDTADEAYVGYLQLKLSMFRSIKPELDNIHPDLYMGLIRHVMSLPRFSK